MSLLTTGLDEQLDRFLRKHPRLGREVYVAAGAVVIGDVTIGDHSSVWFNAVLRGDINRIQIGACTNIQDTAVLHMADELSCKVGDYVTIGHGAIVHACTVGNEVLVGMRSVIMDGAEVGEQSIIGAGTLVPEGLQIPPGSLVLGTPAKIVRALTSEERGGIRKWAQKYVRVSAYYLKHGASVGGAGA